MYVSESILDSKGEVVVHEILQKYGDRFSIQTGVRFFRVISYDLPGITKAEKDYLKTTEFDFLVCEGPKMHPLFAIEYDGIGDDYQGIDKYRSLKKTAKIKACDIAEFPLLWLEPITFIEGISILDAILQSYIGGKAVDTMIENGELSWEESFIYDFPPFVRLNKKYGMFRISNEIFSEHGDFDSVIEKCKFQTDQGIIAIEKKAKVRFLRFPFFHGLELADDIAHYKCLKEFEERLQRKEFTVSGIVQRRKAVIEKFRNPYKPKVAP
jgi:hypothetical protein